MGCGASKSQNVDVASYSALQNKYTANEEEHFATQPPDASEELLSVGRPGTPEGRVAEEPSPIMLRIRMAYTIFMAEMADKQHTAEEMQIEASTGTPRLQATTPRRVAGLPGGGGVAQSLHGGSVTVISSALSPVQRTAIGGTHVPAGTVASENAGTMATQGSNSSLLHHELSTITRRIDELNRWVDGTQPYRAAAAGRPVPTLLTRAERELELQEASASQHASLFKDTSALDGEVLDGHVEGHHGPKDASNQLGGAARDAQAAAERKDGDDGDVELFGESLRDVSALTPRSNRLTPRSTGGYLNGDASGCGAAGGAGGGGGNHLNARNLYRHVNILMQKMAPIAPACAAPPNSVSSAALALMHGSPKSPCLKLPPLRCAAAAPG